MRKMIGRGQSLVNTTLETSTKMPISESLDGSSSDFPIADRVIQERPFPHSSEDYNDRRFLDNIGPGDFTPLD